MKNPKIFIVLPFLFLGLFLISSVQAQTNYKHPQINAKGELMDAQGIKQGWITKEGLIMDAKGKKLAFLDANGNLVDAHGKKMGRAAKNGNYYDEKGAVVLTVSEPKGEQCEVADKSGKVVATVHNNYKTQAACVVHCLSHPMEMKP